MSLKSWLKDAALPILGFLTGRHIALLPMQARREDLMLDLVAPYRAENGILNIEITERGQGRFEAELICYQGHCPTMSVWKGSPCAYDGPSDLTFDSDRGTVLFNGEEWGKVPVPVKSRRFCWRLTLTKHDGERKERLTGHYLPVKDRSIDSGYFLGDDYVDHEAQSAGDHELILQLLRENQASGPVLEIGCATGGLLKALDELALTAVGLDISKWAVEQACNRLGPNRAWACDVENSDFPTRIKSKSPFPTLIFSSVFEHFRDPFAVLEKFTPLAAQGALLVITTTNSESLTHTIFGRQWEGYFDWTHLGIDRVSAHSLRTELPKLGWKVKTLRTHMVWDTSADPTRATLREWWAADARFRRLLAERDLGDLVTCVAVKQ